MQRGIRQRTSGGGRPAEAGYRERTGQRTGTESGGPGGTSRQHTVKSSIHHRPGRYTRCSRAHRYVFTPGDPHGFRSTGMVEILWHRRETRRQTENTHIDLKPDRGLRREQSRPTAVRKSAEGIVVGGNERGLPIREKYTRWAHPDKGPNGPLPNGQGKWSRLRKSVFLSILCNSR